MCVSLQVVIHYIMKYYTGRLCSIEKDLVERLYSKDGILQEI